MKADKKRTIHPKRYRFFYVLLYPIMAILNAIYGFKNPKLSYDRSKRYLIYINHQAPLDPVHVITALRRPVYFVAGMQLFHKGWISKLLTFVADPIPIRKGYGDPSAVVSIFRRAKEGGDVAVFIEGNRTWINQEVNVNPVAAKLAKKIGLPLMILNLNGGFGVSSRFAKKRRKGPFTASIARILTVEEMSFMSVEEVQTAIEQGLDVRDGSHGERYASASRAEYLERLFFVCPSCRGKNSLKSEGSVVRCSCCGHEVTYGEDLSVSSDDPSCSIKTLADWYRIQVDEAKRMDIPDGVIAKDEDCTLFNLDTFPKKRLSKGTVSLTKESFSVGDIVVPTSSIVCASPVQGTLLQIITKDNQTFLVQGHPRFNAVKYVFLFERIIPDYASTGDDYYLLDLPIRE